MKKIQTNRIQLMGKTKYILLTLILISFLMVLGTNESKAQCNWLPSGVSTVPAWTAGSPNARVYINFTCWVEYEWCHRIVAGKKEIIMGRQIVSGSTPWYWFST